MEFWHINRMALPLLLTLSLLLAPKALAADRVTAQANNIDVQFNGRPLELGAYNIANNNYVKLRDVAQLLSGTEKSVSVTWNNDAFCIELIRGGLYQPAGGELTPLSGGSQSAVLNSAAVLLDGQGRGADGLQHRRQQLLQAPGPWQRLGLPCGLGRRHRHGRCGYHEGVFWGGN